MGYTFLFVAHRIEEADDSNIDLINEVYDYSVEHEMCIRDSFGDDYRECRTFRTFATASVARSGRAWRLSLIHI